MAILATFAVAIAALIHILISVVEIFFWKTPVIYERLGFTAEVASQVAPIVQNAGLYNSFIAAGLLWSAVAKEYALPLRTFFLVCVAIAGIFGAITLRPTTLALQTMPALLALILVWIAQKQLKLKPE
jgi:putative membrane protein